MQGVDVIRMAPLYYSHIVIKEQRQHQWTVVQLECQLNTKFQSMGEAKLVFLSFETKYLTPKIGPYIKLKLLKSYIKYKKFRTLDKNEMLKRYENNCNFAESS